MTSIQDEIAAFKTMQTKLEAEHMGRWVLIYQRSLIDVFDSFDQALAEAGPRFGRGPYLIRQVGAPPMTLPASVMLLCRNSMGQVGIAPQSVEDTWTPDVLSEYEVGRAIFAAQVIARSEKPVVEVGCQKVASLQTLIEDLRECVRLAGHADNVHVWTRATDDGQRMRYGFYREAWALVALDFLDRATLADVDRAWIGGLIFGYRADAIQEFINQGAQAASGVPALHEELAGRSRANLGLLRRLHVCGGQYFRLS